MGKKSHEVKLRRCTICMREMECTSRQMRRHFMECYAASKKPLSDPERVAYEASRVVAKKKEVANESHPSPSTETTS